MSIITSPVTISPWPSRVASPARIIGAGWTLATLPIVTGTPLRSSMTIAAMSLDVPRLAHAADVPRLAVVDEVAAADVGVVRLAAR